MTISSRRALYRIVYPMDERPNFEIGRFVYEVIDCSERGIRYHVKDRRVPAVGTPLGGVLQFRRGGEIEITGEVIRTRAGTVALALDLPGIPFSDILGEQRYLRARGYTLRD
ncbi:MAG: PilZ domain-containing protein [Gemmatimonadaceae bacterium]